MKHRAFGTTVQKFLQKVVSPALGGGRVTVDIRTQVTPDIHLDIQKILDDAALKESTPNPFLLLIKPRVTFRGFGFSKTEAPFGEPTKNYIPAVVLTVLLTYLLTFYFGYRIGKPSRRRKKPKPLSANTYP
jgi:hypothetical protein